MSEIIEMEVLTDDSELDMEVEQQNGTMDHSKLMNRDKTDQHPISAITGLQGELDGKQPTGSYATPDDVAQAQAEAESYADGVAGAAVGMAVSVAGGQTAEQINGHDNSGTAHNDIRDEVTGALTASGNKFADASYNPATGILKLIRGTLSEKEVNLPIPIPYSGINGTTVNVGVAVGGAISAEVKDGTLDKTKLTTGLAAELDGKQVKPTVESVMVNTPAYTNNPTVSGTLNAAFVVGETYFVNLGTDGEFTLMTRFNDPATAVAQTLTLPSYDTGNSGVLTQNTAVQFLSIAGDRLSFVMRAAGISFISFTSRPSKCKLTFAGVAVPSGTVNLYTRISLGSIIVDSNVFTTNTRTTYKNKMYIFPAMAMPNHYNTISGSIEYEMRGKHCYGVVTQYLNSNKFYPPSSAPTDVSVPTPANYPFAGMSVNGLDMVSNITEFLFSSENWVMLNGTEVKLEVYS